MFRILRSFLNWFAPAQRASQTPQESPYTYQLVEDVPDTPEDRRVYVLGSKEYPWQVAFNCPCGCRDVIQLYTNLDSKPRWDVRFERKEKITLYPSIRRSKGCRSHFFLESGRIIWCRFDDLQIKINCW